MRNVILILLISLASCSVNSQQNTETAKNNVDTRKEVVCFVYHRFGDSRFSSTNISIADFESHLKYLKENHYQILTLADAIDYLRNEEPVKKTAVITIDDGYKSFYQNGFPILKQYAFPATLFINTETVGASDYMGWEELKTVIQDDIEIGNHTHSHDYFMNMDKTVRYTHWRNDIIKSQEIILEKLNTTPVVFAYPYGEFDLTMKEVVKDIGFKGAAAQNSGVLHNLSDSYLIPRFPMSESYSGLAKFKEKASMHALKILKESPKSPTVEAERPALTLKIASENLQWDRIQCFIQGSDCHHTINHQSDSVSTLSITPTHSIKARRRTLYTITIPDRNGQWHWFSHLWINEKVK